MYICTYLQMYIFYSSNLLLVINYYLVVPTYVIVFV